MSVEGIKPPKAVIDIDTDAENQYTLATGNANLRRFLYQKYSAINIYELIHELAGLEGTEDVLDVACGDGITSLRISDNGRHNGHIVAVDKNPDNFVVAGQTAKGKINFIAGDARALALPDDSFDTAFFNFGIYHMERPEDAVLELHRVLKPGGRGVISTRSVMNLAKLYAFSAQVADRLEADFPGSPYPNCDFQKTRELLNQLLFRPSRAEHLTFEVVDEPLYIPEAGFDDYFNAVFTQTTRMMPRPPAGSRAIVQDVVKPVFDHEVNCNGYFEEFQSQGIFVFQKTP